MDGLYCTTSLNCPEDYNKLIKEKGQCLKKCDTDSKYIYEFRKECFEKCPNGTKESDSNPHFCEIICPKNSPLEIISNQTCVSYCSINDLNEGLYKFNYEDNDTNSELILNNILKYLTIL